LQSNDCVAAGQKENFNTSSTVRAVLTVVVLRVCVI
jgi:hypothetical protein